MEFTGIFEYNDIEYTVEVTAIYPEGDYPEVINISAVIKKEIAGDEYTEGIYELRYITKNREYIPHDKSWLIDPFYKKVTEVLDNSYGDTWGWGPNG